MKKLTTRLAMHAAFVALFATGAIVLPTLMAFKHAEFAGHAFAKDGDSGESDSDSDGGDSGSDGDGGDSDSGSDGGHSDSDHDSHDDGNSGSGNSHDDHDDADDSDDSSDDSSSNDDNDDRSGRESRDRSEVTVSLSPEQVQAILGGQSKLVDSLGRTLELEIETEDGVTTYTAKPHGGDARRNPGPVTDVSVVPATRAPVNGSANDDGTPDQGPGVK